MIDYSRTFDKDGIPYDGLLRFKTVEGHFDFFPWGRLSAWAGSLFTVTPPLP